MFLLYEMQEEGIEIARENRSEKDFTVARTHSARETAEL